MFKTGIPDSFWCWSIVRYVNDIFQGSKSVKSSLKDTRNKCSVAFANVGI